VASAISKTSESAMAFIRGIQQQQQQQQNAMDSSIDHPQHRNTQHAELNSIAMADWKPGDGLPTPSRGENIREAPMHHESQT